MAMAPAQKGKQKRRPLSPLVRVGHCPFRLVRFGWIDAIGSAFLNLTDCIGCWALKAQTEHDACQPKSHTEDLSPSWLATAIPRLCESDTAKQNLLLAAGRWCFLNLSVSTGTQRCKDTTRGKGDSTSFQQPWKTGCLPKGK